MQIATKTLRFQIDERFSGRQVQHESGSLWDPLADRSAQLPMFHFALSEVKDLYEGFASADQDYTSALRTYFGGKRPHVQSFEDETQLLAGRQAFIRRSWAKGPDGAETFHLFVNIRLDDDHMQEFSADCSLGVRDVYEPLFLEAVAGASWSGDFAAALVESDRQHEEAMRRIEALSTHAEHPGSSAPSTPNRKAPRSLPFDPGPDASRAASDARIGPWKLDLAGGSSSWSIGSLTQFLHIEASGACDPNAELLCPYSGDSNITVRIQAQGIYGDSGAPTGAFWVNDGRCETQGIHLEIDGVEFRLNFTGWLSLGSGWVGLEGKLGCSYEDRGTFEVLVQLRLDPAALRWSDYCFTDLEELERAQPDEVCSSRSTASWAAIGPQP